MEDNTGYLSANFFKLEFNEITNLFGPFVEKIFKIVGLQKKTIDILMGNLKTKIDRRKFYLILLKRYYDNEFCKKVFFTKCEYENN